MNPLLRAVLVISGISQCQFARAGCDMPASARTDAGAAKYLLDHFDLVGVAVVSSAQNGETRQPERLHFALTFKGDPGEVTLKSPFNSDGTITVTNNQTSLGLADKAAALVALTKVEGAFVYSECAAGLLGTRQTTKLLRALTRYGEPRFAK